MPYSDHEIVFSNDSATFWTGASWDDDLEQAQVFDSPREAWRAAVGLAVVQQEYLDGTAVALYLRDRETGELSVATTTDFSNLRPALRGHWKTHFGEALPPDLPHPVVDSAGAVQRMWEYVEDTDWNAVRAQGSEDPDLGLDPAFWDTVQRVRFHDLDTALAVWDAHVPKDIPLPGLIDPAVRAGTAANMQQYDSLRARVVPICRRKRSSAPRSWPPRLHRRMWCLAIALPYPLSSIGVPALGRPDVCAGGEGGCGSTPCRGTAGAGMIGPADFFTCENRPQPPAIR